jgi:uncharacterized protein (TIGR04255 family)
MARPQHLPDFGSPPLEEVVVGVQFAPPSNYSSVLARDVWEIFKDKYPNVEEHPPLEPAFETFGGSNLQSGLRFQIGTGPLRSRLWFISNEQDHLIQFQEDRFLLNWRRRPEGKDYPRFETIADSFRSHLGSLEQFFRTSLDANLDISQAEISYINIIPVTSYSHLGEWFGFSISKNIDVENLQVHFSEVVNDADGKPCARLNHELQSVVMINGKVKAFRLSLIFRGRPAGKEISKAMAFIYGGREKIVTRFCELTTSDAHAKWERMK